MAELLHIEFPVFLRFVRGLSGMRITVEPAVFAERYLQHAVHCEEFDCFPAAAGAVCGIVHPDKMSVGTRIFVSAVEHPVGDRVFQ